VARVEINGRLYTAKVILNQWDIMMTAVEAQDFPQIKTFFSFQGLLKETLGATGTRFRKRLDTGGLLVFGEVLCPRCTQSLSWQCERGTTGAECPSSWISGVKTSSSSTDISRFFCTRSFRISTILFAPG